MCRYPDVIPLSKLPLFMYGEKGGKGGLRVRRTSVPGYWVTPSSDLQRLDGLGPLLCMNRIIPKGIPVLPPHGATHSKMASALTRV